MKLTNVNKLIKVLMYNVFGCIIELYLEQINSKCVSAKYEHN